MANIINQEFEASSVSPPGDTLQELLEERGVTQADLARRLGLTTKHVNEIIKGKAPITPDTAIGLERVLGASATFWNNRERRYREFIARKEEEARLSSRLDWIDQFPVKEMIRYGFISAGRTKVEQTQAMLSFLGIASPSQWTVLTEQPQVQYRKQVRFESNPAAVAVWLRQAEQLGQSINCAPFNAEALRDALPSLRLLTLEEPAVFKIELVKQCAACGVAVTFVPELPRTCLYGAARWLSPTKALVALSLRGKTNDKLWFTFFHECGHLLLHGKRDVFIDEEKGEGGKEEEEADRFAGSLLIPERNYKVFVGARTKFFAPDIRAFASSIQIHPGIVVGRLQRDGHLPFSMCNDLKRRYEWKANESA